MPQFILFLRGGEETQESYTPEEMQEAIQKHSNWAVELRNEGALAGGEKLVDHQGRIIQSRNNQIVVDGPFAETKETIGGFYQIKARDLDHAIELAKGCPTLGSGGSIELREIESFGDCAE